MTTALITGANKGIGYETARQLLAAGHDVWIGARDGARGQRAASALGANFVQLDVTDDASVAAAVQTVGALDVLVNNAGISVNGQRSPGETSVPQMREIYETNVFGPVRVLGAFLALLERSASPVPCRSSRSRARGLGGRLKRSPSHTSPTSAHPPPLLSARHSLPAKLALIASGSTTAIATKTITLKAGATAKKKKK